MQKSCPRLSPSWLLESWCKCFKFKEPIQPLFMQPAAAQPIQQNQRTAIIDMLRGWALLGVVLMNYVDFYYEGIDFPHYKPGASTQFFQYLTGIVFSAKSWTMLSFLFGYGFAVLLQNIKQKGLNTVSFFSRRMFWLLMLALANSAFFLGDILKDYAVMGMVLLLFTRLSAKTSLYISIGLFLIAGPLVGAYIASLHRQTDLASYYYLYKSHNPFKVLWFGLVGTFQFEILNLQYLITVHISMLGCFLLGQAAQKIHFFTRLTENKRWVKRVFWITLASSIFLICFFNFISKPNWPIYKYYNPRFFTVMSTMILIVASLSWLYLAGKLKSFFKAMQTIGSMTLTNYMVQNFLGLFLFSGLGFAFAFNKIHIGYYLLFALAIYVAQVYLSKWWLARYYYGPVEWVWRQLSYGKRLPIRKEQLPQPVVEELQSLVTVV
jgi:uncharacterized protein